MFEVGGEYANRIGKYTVLKIDDPKMTVRYEDGTEAELKMSIQGRIWENILAEEEARTSRSARAANRGKGSSTQFFIKPVSMLEAEGLALPGLKEQVSAVEVAARNFRPGDRIIYYAVEGRVFFAVVTITGAPAAPKGSKRNNKQDTDQSMYTFTLDVDASTQSLEKAVSLDSVEFESQPNIAETLDKVGSFVTITEDEFELLAESLTEVAVEDDEDEEIEDEEDESFDE